MSTNLGPVSGPRPETGVDGSNPGLLRDLDEAVDAFVQPGMTLHVDPSAQAAVRSLLRVFRGSKPHLTIVAVRAGFVAPDLIQAGLVRKVICGGLVNPFLRPTDAASVQLAYEDGSVEFEHWSLYSLVLRLMAGALGWGIVPTRSIAGSTMAERNKGSFATLPNPFNDPVDVTVLRPLVPDFSIVHAACSTTDGHALFLPPYEENLWGAKSSKCGVLVVADQIVDTETARRYPYFAKLPASRIRAVAEAPWASHPYGIASAVPALMGTRDDDVRFLQLYQRAVRDPGRHTDWLQDWVYGVGSQAEYLAQVASATRVLDTDRAPQPRGGMRDVASVGHAARGTPSESGSSTLNSVDRIVLAAAKRIAHKVVDEGFDTILVGAGLAATPCIVAYHLLKQMGRRVQLVSGTGTVDFIPHRRDRDAEFHSAFMLTDTTEAYGVLVGGPPSRSLALLSAAQIDRFGNLNTTEIGTRTFLTGSGGANDAASLATEVMVVTRYRPGRFVDRVDFVTSPGRRVTSLITDVGVLEKAIGDNELKLKTTFIADDAGLTVSLAAFESTGGWRISISDELVTEPLPSAEDLAVLRLLLPSNDNGGE